MKKVWDQRWNKLNEKPGITGRLLTFYRKKIIANAVSHYIERYFPEKGIFVEMGSGTAQTSVKIRKKQRTIIALDISRPALMQAKKIPQVDKVVQGNILHLKFKNNSIDGIWNVGVMEHFNEQEITRILKEFERVLKPGSYALLFWPPVYGSTIMFFGFMEMFINLLKKEKFHFFPDEPTRYKSKAQLHRMLSKTKLKFVATHFNCMDFFTHAVVVCQKPR